MMTPDAAASPVVLSNAVVIDTAAPPPAPTTGQEDPGARRQEMHRAWRYLRMLLAVLATVLLMSWLFVRADAINIREHQQYLWNLYQVRQADAELMAAVLTSHLGLRADFDGIVQASDGLWNAVQSLENVPTFLSASNRARLREKVAVLRQEQSIRMEDVDAFKRVNAITRNSMDILPLLKSNLENVPIPGVLRDRTDELLNGALTHTHKLAPEVMVRLNRRLLELKADRERQRARSEEYEELDNLLRHVQNKKDEAVDNLLQHIQIIFENKPELDQVTLSIMEYSAADLAEEITALYADAYGQALRVARLHRVVLYVLGLLLAGMLGMIFLRLQRTTRALEYAHDDLRERFDALQRAQSELALFGRLFSNAREGMMITDAEQRIVAVNASFVEITGYDDKQIIGMTPNVLSSGKQDEAFYREFWDALKREGRWQGEIWNRRQNGEAYPEWLSVTVVRNETGDVVNYVGIFSDISERKSAEARIHHLAHYDALTNLPNRALLQDRLEQAILQSRRKNKQTAVLFVDLDRFKPINDSFGQHIGDELLIQVGERLQHVVREVDTVARYGSDEFVVVSQDLEQSQDAAMIARKLLGALNQPYRLAQHEMTVTASIGVAIYPEDGDTVATLLRNADVAMYGAKTGLSGMQFYSEDMNTDSIGELLLQNQLRGAIDRQELLLYYQPKVDAATGKLVGAEALLRWQHPELGLLSPIRFVPAAEDSGLIVPIGGWVLRTACRQLRQWLDAGLEPLPIAVNLSVQQLMQENLTDFIGEVLMDNLLPPGLLQIELTETMLMRDVKHAARVLECLRDMGVGVSIDDFGSGYSSLTYLQTFAVDLLKIDRSFVLDIGGEGQGKIAGAIIALAHSMGLKVLAEGVETTEQRDFLLKHGCDQIQGFLFGYPEPVDVFSLRLARRNILSP